MDTNHKHTPRAATALTLLLLTTTVMGGCSEKFTDYEAFLREPRPVVTSTEYRMAPPDVVLLQSKLVREVNGHREMISPDGRINLPLLGEHFVAGRTCAEVAKDLQAAAREYYADADVAIRVVEYRSKKIYVFGEVALAGPYPYDGTNSVLRTLAFAQPTRLADPANIHVMRPNAKGELVKRMTISLDDMVKKGVTEHDAVLEEGDILYVPPNGLAAIGLAFQQLLLPIQPAAATVAGPGSIENSVTGRTYGRVDD